MPRKACSLHTNTPRFTDPSKVVFLYKHAHTKSFCHRKENDTSIISHGLIVKRNRKVYDGLRVSNCIYREQAFHEGNALEPKHMHSMLAEKKRTLQTKNFHLSQKIKKKVDTRFGIFAKYFLHNHLYSSRKKEKKEREEARKNTK